MWLMLRADFLPFMEGDSHVFHFSEGWEKKYSLVGLAWGPGSAIQYPISNPLCLGKVSEQDLCTNVRVEGWMIYVAVIPQHSRIICSGGGANLQRPNKENSVYFGRLQLLLVTSSNTLVLAAWSSKPETPPPRVLRLQESFIVIQRYTDHPGSHW